MYPRLRLVCLLRMADGRKPAFSMPRFVLTFLVGVTGSRKPPSSISESVAYSLAAHGGWPDAAFQKMLTNLLLNCCCARRAAEGRLSVHAAAYGWRLRAIFQHKQVCFFYAVHGWRPKATFEYIHVGS